MPDIVLLRHNKTLAEPGVIAGRSDVEALALSADQRAFIAPRIKGLAVISSPAKRCTALAHDLALKPVKFEPQLWEQNFGDWEGQRWDAIGAEHPFWVDPANNRPPAGESFADVIARVRALPLPSQDTLLLCHAGVIRAYLAIALDLEPQVALRFQIPHASLTRLSYFTGGHWSVSGVGLTA